MGLISRHDVQHFTSKIPTSGKTPAFVAFVVFFSSAFLLARASHNMHFIHRPSVCLLSNLNASEGFSTPHSLHFFIIVHTKTHLVH
jgi:hypothetical protein